MSFKLGKATHYGPFPIYPAFSELGYQALDVGVGCSNGQPGGDPRWQKILSAGTFNDSEIQSMANINVTFPPEMPIPNPKFKNQVLDQLRTTVWPKAYTVAVSEKAYGGKNKQLICFQPIKIRNAKNPSYQITAYIVDFCPATGCNWPRDELTSNVDVYGQAAWFALGGTVGGGLLSIEVEWPPGIKPNENSGHFEKFSLFVLYAFLFYIALA
jgi:hypothetical protein